MTQLVRLVESNQDSEGGFSDLSLSRKGYLLYVKEVIVSLSVGLNEAELTKLRGTELLYGAGNSGLYGQCLYDKWIRDGIQDVIEVSAFCAGTPVEMWCTVAHELSHVGARGKGHDAVWKAFARKLGMQNPRAAGPARIEDLDADLVAVLKQIPLPTDGEPICDEPGGVAEKTRKSCTAGIGTREGKTRGPGSGRLRLWICDCDRPKKVRIASDDFHARCLICFSLFRREGTTRATGTALIKWGGPANGGAATAHIATLQLPSPEVLAPTLQT